MPHRAATDAATAVTGLTLSQIVAGASDVLQLGILVLTVILLLFRIRNARQGRGGD